jgi:hypothetical protein
MRRPPNEQELNGLRDAFIKEEIYYREALKLNLDNNDTIVRRRLVQKLMFLTEDIATAESPSEGVLKDFYADQITRYEVPTKYTFAHRYFSSDRRDNSEEVATKALTDLEVKSDPFMLQKEYAQRSQREISNLFGQGFAQSLANLKASENWQGPLKSAYGWHAIKLLKVIPSRTLAFAEVADKVAVDWQQSLRKAANEAYFTDLKARYSITYSGVAPINSKTSTN